MKKILTWLLSFALALGFTAFVQPTAMAADTPESVTAYLTVSLNDADGKPCFAKARDGSEMAAKAVQVSDRDYDGKLTVYDLLVCAHESLAPGGANDFAAASGSGNAAIAKKVWGSEGSFYFLEGKAVNFYKQFSGNLKYDAYINEFTHLTVVQSTKTDFFSNATIPNAASGNFYNSKIARITALSNQQFTVGLYTVDFSKTNPKQLVQAAKNRDVYYKQVGNSTEKKAGTTDASGKINVKLSNSGDYLFYTKDVKSGIAPAACMVHVAESKPVPQSIQLGLSEDKTDLLTYNSETTEYTITVPDNATKLYGRMKYASAPFNLKWYSEISTDGTTYKGANLKNSLDGETAGGIDIINAQKLKLYINDASLQTAGNSPLSDEYMINIKRQVQLTGLTTNGSQLSNADYTTGYLDVYVSHDAQTATLTPTAKSGDTITVNGSPAESGKAASVTLTGDDTTATIVVQRNGENYVEGTYTVVFHKAADQAAPVFIEQPASEVQEYIVEDGPAYVKPLHVFANANGPVTYQWYSNTTNSTEGGIPIAGETSTEYSPATDTVEERYYYCIASNGDSKTSSAVAHVIVYDYPIKSISWNMDIPDLPQDKADLFGKHKKGFYYEKGDTDVTPLTVAVTYVPHFAKLIENGTIRVHYNWGPLNDSVPTSLPSYKPSTDYEIGGQKWYCRVSFNYLGEFRNFNKTTSVPVYVYIGKDSSSRPDTIEFTGAGTQTSPWELSSQADLEKLRAYVEGGYDFADTYLIFTKDIALDENWKSIGTGSDGTKGKSWNVFSGTLDGGNHTLTYAENTDQPLFKYVREATVQNLSIKAPHLKNYALVSNYAVDYGDDGVYSIGTGGSYAPGCPDTIDIINVTIKSGSIIEKGGFLGGFASGANIVNIRDCTAEKDVKIGWDGEKGVGSNNGSFAGLFNGTMSNCVSYADVYGQNFVGGMAGQKGQSMGPYEFTNCSFMGKIEATGKFVGGIAGGGYAADSAPNTPGATIQNCYVSGTITGADCVGGILGGEPSQIQAWDTSYIQDNCFYGTVTATDENASCGGIVGRFKSLNINNTISNNYFLDGCGADNGIGAILYLDTSADVTAENCEVFDTSKELPKIRGVSLSNLNRTDDPLGTDADKLAAKKTADEFKDGTAVSLLNASDSSWKNWTQGTNGPVHSREPIFYRLEVSGSYKATYKQGEELDLTGIEFTAYRSDNTSVKLSLQDVKQLNTFDPQFIGAQTITFRYGVGEATITLAVLKDYTDADRENFKSVEVLFSLSEDDAFKTGTSNTMLANVPLKVTYFDLSQYGLEAYNYHENGKLVEEPTVLHLFITALERYGLGLSEEQCGKGRLTVGTNWLTVTGGAGHLYMTSFWKHGANLIYDVNGKYPMKPDGSMGATADEIVLKDGDFVDVAMFSDASFYTHETSGFHFFAETQNTPQKLFRVPHGEELTLSYLLSHSDMGSGSDVASTLTTVSGESVYSGTSIDEKTTSTAATDADGKVTLTFAAEGTYYAWTKGGKVAIDNNPNLKPVVVSAPGCAIIVVTKTAEEVDELIDAICEVTKDSGDAIRAARAAYDSLSEKTKSEVQGYEKLTAAEKRYNEILNPSKPGSTIKIDSPNKPKKDTVTVDASKFNDVSRSDWYYNAVQYALENGLMNGTSDWAFSPNADTTRGMIVTILARLDGVNTSGNPWYAAGRTWAMNAGVSDGTNIEGKITREQLAAMLYRYAKAKGYDVAASADISGYTDASNVSSWAVDAMRWAVGAGLINGRTATTLASQGNATRAEVAAILMRFAQNVAK